MSSKRNRAPRRKRVGRVSYYSHHGSWYIYYRDGSGPKRVRIGQNEAEAARMAAERNAELAGGRLPAPRAFEPITVDELRRRFLDHHEHVVCSSLATVDRYRAATAYLETYANSGHSLLAHEVQPDAFLRWLRAIQIAPNGHVHSRRRGLRERGIRFILNTCRSLYHYAAKRRHLPPYAENPFSDLASLKLREDDAKPVFVFDERTEKAFLEAADDGNFPIHFMLAKTGLRPGEASRVLVEELDQEGGWLHVRSKPELVWRVKTRRERAVPLIAEVVQVLRKVVSERTAGPLFLRPQFKWNASPVGNLSLEQMAAVCRERTSSLEKQLGRTLCQRETARVAETVWRDAGAIDPDDIRRSFIRVAKAIGVPGATCPKSWRHSFATLLQDANVDPLIRQITMGHAPAGDPKNSLRMTAVYTHTRPETQRREVERALRLWPESLCVAERRAVVAPDPIAISNAGQPRKT